MNSSIVKIEKRLLLEKYLKESLIHHKPLLDCDSDAIYAMDLDGYFLPVNPACEQLFGYEAEEFSKLSYMKVIVLEHLERAFSFFYQSVDGKLQNFDCQIIHKSGEIIDVNITNYPILIDGKIVGVYGVAKNITEIKQKRKKYIEEMQHREEIYREIVEHSPDAVVIARNEEVLFANDTAVALIGALNKYELIGRNLFDFVDPCYYDVVEKRVKDVEKGSAVDFMEQRLIRKDGKKIEVEVKSIPAIYQNEPARHIIIRDITEKKRTQELLLQSEKLSVAGQLAAGIAHEIRNPITAIKGFIRLMEAANEFKQNYLEIINSEMNRIELILSELLLLSKPQKMKFKRGNILTILEHVKALIDTQAIMNNVEIEIQSFSEIPSFICDENQLKQLFINFLKNSIEAMPNGGKITIEVGLLESNQIQLRVIDQGCGIPEEQLHRIGQPFFTTKEKGTGLGLMISLQIIDNHNGTFQIFSNQNGTTIVTTFPI
ncbi:PAS domain S-box protein [Neobacillus sp. LXY-1]|uniref:PAS domain S-box protein n=1 Tax=Neobacillus sp. LXY-1 TaxID=3379133 RepID=UPI003EE0E6D7